MKVYIVMREKGLDSDILGVYSSKKKAEEFINKHTFTGDYSYFAREIDVDFEDSWT